MNDRRTAADRLNSLDGADAGALGMTPAPESAPPGAEVSGEENLVPGADFDRRPRDQAKPWHTSLAAESEQAGVANDPPDAQEPLYPTTDEDPR
jgi:hypothetical protein